MRRLLLILACLLVLVLVAAPFVIAWAAVYTEAGAQFLARRVPRQIGDVGLEIVGVTGTIAGGLHVERVEIDHPLVHLTFTDIDGRVAPGPALDAGVPAALAADQRRAGERGSRGDHRLQRRTARGRRHQRGGGDPQPGDPLVPG